MLENFPKNIVSTQEVTVSPEGVEMETRPDNSEEVNDAENAINCHDIIARLDLYLHDSSY